MTIALAIFAKNPHLTPVKTRLAQDIGKENAIHFYRLCLQYTRELALELIANSAQAISPYWALAEHDSLLLPEWQCFNTLWTGEGELGDRLHHVYSTLLTKHEAVIMIGTDSPALPSSLLHDAIKNICLDINTVAIGPAKDGGFYLFGGSRAIDPSIWLAVPYSSVHTLEILHRELQNHNIPVALMPEHFDVDTHNDLLLLKDYLQQGNYISDTQHRLLQFMRSTGI